MERRDSWSGQDGRRAEPQGDAWWALERPGKPRSFREAGAILVVVPAFLLYARPNAGNPFREAGGTLVVAPATLCTAAGGRWVSVEQGALAPRLAGTGGRKSTRQP